MRRAPHSARRAAIFLGIVLGACGFAAAARAQEELLQELKKVTRVELVGRRHVSAGAIRKVLKTKNPSFWPWRERPTLRYDYLAADTQAIGETYRHNGFIDVQVGYRVTTSDSSDKAVVAFLIREGQRSEIRTVGFAGNSVYSARDLRKKLWAKVDRPFDPAFLQLDTLTISALYQEKGYRPHIAAGYLRRHPDSTSIDVGYGIEEGERYKVGEVTVSGQDKVKEKLITRELLLKPGAAYQLSRVTRSQEHLYETGLFSQVQIEPLPDSTHTTMNFDVRLRERRPRWIDAGIGSGTEERFRLTGEWGHRNLGGQALQGAVSSRLTFAPDANEPKQFMRFQRWHVEASIAEPWLFHTRTRGIVIPFYERYDDRADSNWVLRQEFKGINFRLRRELNRFAYLTLSQENVYVRQEVTIRNLAAVTPREADSLANTAEPDYTTHRLSLAFDRDIRDNPFSPTRGGTTRLLAELAGGPFHGTSSFGKYQVSATWYTPLRNGWIVATRAQAGYINPSGARPTFTPLASVAPDSEVARVPLEDRFRMGGVNSIRGYNENSIPDAAGGLAMAETSVEVRLPTPLRIPFLGTVGIEGYADVGNVWPRPAFMSWDSFSRTVDADPNAIRIVAGVGPRVDLPIGPLRVDITWHVRPTPSHAVVQFAIGPSF